jgi:Family of unknown function (DUF6230)
MVPAAVTAGGVLGAVATGAVAASVAASGDAFKVSGDQLSGSGFTAVPGMSTDPKTKKRHPVLVVTAQQAELSNLCVSVLVKTPLGPVTVRVTAGQDKPVKASGLVVDTDQLHGEADFSHVTAQPTGGTAADGGGLLAQSQHVTVKNPQFTGWKGTAGSFHLNGLGVGLKLGAHECF